MRIGLKTRIAGGLLALGAALGTTLAVPGMYYAAHPGTSHASSPNMYYAAHPNMYYAAHPNMYYA